MGKNYTINSEEFTSKILKLNLKYLLKNIWKCIRIIELIIGKLILMDYSYEVFHYN